MRKNAFMIMTVFILGLALFLSDYSSVFKPDKLVQFKVSDQGILHNENGSWVPYTFYGVNINPGVPSVFPGEDFVEQEVYVQWLDDISKLGMNSVRVLDLMPETFYKALYEFNENSQQPIYILQGITFDEVRLKQGVDPTTKDAKMYFKNHIESVVNAVHGNPSSKSNIPFFDSYTTDVSGYILGFCLGPDWQSHDIVYAELMHDVEPYEGKYFSSSKWASVFEAYIAEMLDYLAVYEGDQYDVQHLVSYIGSIGVYQNKYAATPDGRTLLLEKISDSDIKSYIDYQNIERNDALESGFFISYNVYNDDAFNVEGERHFENIYSKLVALHDVPVVITEYGYPATRLATDYIIDEVAYISEQDQGKRIIETLNQIEDAQCGGSFLMEWKDSWFKSAWNTRNRKILDSSPYWSDAQTYSQFYGLIAYEPYRDDRTIYPDDSIAEWSEEDVVYNNEMGQFSVTSDEKYIYILLEKKSLLAGMPNMYVDFDVTPKSGVLASEQLGLSFEKPIDFVLELKGRTGGRLLVHEYYNTYRFEKSLEALKRRPDIVMVKEDMDEFSPVIIDVVSGAEVLDYDNIQLGESVETGRFYYGNGNPNSKDYLSYSDYYMGDDYLEVRMPWALLNFMDPSKKMIHGDYYDLYNIEPKVINNLSIGITIQTDTGELLRFPSQTYEWDDWVEPTYKMRYKMAYELLKQRGQRGD